MQSQDKLVVESSEMKLMEDYQPQLFSDGALNIGTLISTAPSSQPAIIYQEVDKTLLEVVTEEH